jgi:hypothetical protein
MENDKEGKIRKKVEFVKQLQPIIAEISINLRLITLNCTCFRIFGGPPILTLRLLK